MRSAGSPNSKPAVAPLEVVLPWIVQLRWVAVGGQLLALASFGLWAPSAVPWVPLLLFGAATVATNLGLGRWRHSGEPATETLLGAVLLFDTLLLTGILAVTGGPENPFAVLYVVHLAMAAVVGGRRWAWGISLVVVIGYAAQFRWHLQPEVWHRVVVLPGLDVPVKTHLLGMWLSVAIVALVVTYFVQRIIAALRRHEHALRETRERLARTQRLTSLTTLAAGAAHELGSPLATVAVVARELERDALESGERGLMREASVIRDEVDRCREILERMSAGLRRDWIEEAPRTAAALEELLREELGADADRVELHAEESLRTDVGLSHLAQLVLPLVRNGVDASGELGRVSVSLIDEEGHLRIDVRDRGSGMQEAVLDRAVEPFFSTKPPGSGRGLGLHLVRLVSEAMGGELRLRSRPGEGTHATLTLPGGIAASGSPSMLGARPSLGQE